MKDSITEARESMEFANAAPDSQWRTEFTAMAQAYAAIAQAEQLKRIADNLDLIVQEWGKPHYIVNPILK